MNECPAVFLLCSERSGSNLICRMFDAHSSFCAPSPAHLLRIFGQNVHRYAASDAGWEAFRLDVQRLFRAKVSPWRLDDDPDAPRLPERWSDSFASPLLQMYRREAGLNGKRGLFIKENQLYSFWPFIAREVPDAAILFQTRDPRDMAVSWQASPLIRGGVVRASRVWRQDQEAALRLVGFLRPHHRVATVRYEDLVVEPDRTLKSACAALDVEFEPSMLEFHTRESARRHAGGSVDWRNVARPLLRGNPGKYRTALDEDQLAYVEAVCGPLMKALGYTPATPSGSPYGRFDNFKALEEALEAQEPWEKPAFHAVPASEREMRETWSAVRSEIVRRPPVSWCDASE